MILDREPFNSWFGFTRRERRSALILLIIAFMVLALRYTVPEKSIEIETVLTGSSGTKSQYEYILADISSTNQQFLFDPNTASYDTLIKIGFASGEANTLIKYRNKGGKFEKPSDIRKVYGVDREKAEKLIPFIEISTNTSEEVRNNNSYQKRALLDINSCDSASLVDLPGIGPVLSARIIKYRHLLGGFARTDQLKEVYGLPEETYELIKERVFADTSTITKIKINFADYKMLKRLPYFENYEVTAILKYREVAGKLAGISDLVNNKVLTKEKAGKVKPYLSFE